MKNTPSALKWLAEKRARVAHDLEQTERIAADVAKRLGSLRLDLDALDRAVRIHDPSVDPSAIAPVNGWKGHYGKRGALKETVRSILMGHYGEWLATDNIEVLVCLKLNITFESPSERKRWYDNSFRRILKNFVAEGLIERRHDPEEFTREVGYWRWASGVAPTLAELAQQTSAEYVPG